MGIIVAIGVLFVFLNCLILTMNIASRCNTLFYRLIAVGFGVTMAFQVFLTVGGVLKIIPLTGVTLPFVSYGGSSLICSLFMFAVINGMYTMRQDPNEAEKADITYRRREHKKVEEKIKKDPDLTEDFSEYFKDGVDINIPDIKTDSSSKKVESDKGHTNFTCPDDFKNIDDYNESVILSFKNQIIEGGDSLKNNDDKNVNKKKSKKMLKKTSEKKRVHFYQSLLLNRKKQEKREMLRQISSHSFSSVFSL